MTTGLNPSRGWTEERVELVKKHFHNGLTASESARALGGVSRNAVIGKRLRLGLAHGDRAAAVRVDSAQVNKRIAARAKAPPVKRAPHQNAGLAFKTRTFAPGLVPVVALPVQEQVHATPPAATPLRICDPGFGGCRWPLTGEREELLFCCAPRREGQTYCDFHRPLAVSGKKLQPLKEAMAA
jgi:GcrA cell cycle regulator